MKLHRVTQEEIEKVMAGKTHKKAWKSIINSCGDIASNNELEVLIRTVCFGEYSEQ